LGDTTSELSKRGDYVPMHDVIAELNRWKKVDGGADHITLAGSGEPTLHNQFGEVFRWVKAETQIASVLLTNGTLLHDAAVRRDAALADKVKVTLSAWNEASFQQIHRPAQDVSFDLLVRGERAFREEYAGELSVEVFIIEGVNSHPDQVQKIATIVETLCPDRIDLNTAVRPPADSGVKAVGPEKLAELAKILGAKAQVTASFKQKKTTAQKITSEALLGLIQRHPATAEQMARDFNVPAETIVQLVTPLVNDDKLRIENRDGEIYYFSRTN
jgi:wyosine [tRNA(Phe)-imidazoG37] synthetase (radical SAM superfamily)